MLFLTQFTKELREVVGNKSIIIGEMLRTELRNFLAGDIAVHTIQECRIGTHFTRERLKQTGGFKQHIHTLIDIAYKDHTGRSRLFLFATSKGAGSHVVLHDLDAVFVLEVDACNLVKGHAIPQANEADCLSAHVVEQVCYRGLTTGYKDAVRGYFFIQMALAGTTRLSFLTSDSGQSLLRMSTLRSTTACFAAAFGVLFNLLMRVRTKVLSIPV